MLGYQAKLVLIGEDSPPWDIVRYGEEREARNYLKLTGEYSLLRGALYLEGLARVNATHTYEFTGKGSMEYALGSDWEITGSRAVYANQGDKPSFEGISLEYRPVIDRRIHVAGTIDALLEAKFGASARVLGYVETAALPTGIYNVTALRDKVLEDEVLRGEVSMWKPTSYRDGEEVQFATLSLLESEKLYKEAIRTRDPVMFYIAADNLQIHSPRSTAARAMLALLSLDPMQGKALAEELDRDPRVSYPQVIRVFEDFRRWYAQETLGKARNAVRESLEMDAYSRELEEVLMYLALEADRTDLDSKNELKDIYEGYRDYYGPHTKDYENLARMAKHIPEYKSIVEAIENRDYAGARRLIEALPMGKPREVLYQRITMEEGRLAALKGEVIEALKSGDYALAANLALGHEELADELNASDPEVGIMRGVAEGVVYGKLSREAARGMLSNLDAFSMWRAEEKTTPPPPPSERNESKPDVESSEEPVSMEGGRSPLIYLLVGASAAILVAIGLKLKRRRERPGRR
jgi:NTP pyrophosphatase (non-canonical NTP hydrolase)